MSVHTTREYRCDVCAAVITTSDKQEEPRIITGFTIEVVEEQEWATDVYKATHICSACRSYIRDFVTDLRSRK